MIIERVHHVVGDILRTREIKYYTFDEIDPYGSIIHKFSWAIRSTYHTNNQASPSQLVFGRDMLFNMPPPD